MLLLITPTMSVTDVKKLIKQQFSLSKRLACHVVSLIMMQQRQLMKLLIRSNCLSVKLLARSPSSSKVKGIMSLIQELSLKSKAGGPKLKNQEM